MSTTTDALNSAKDHIVDAAHAEAEDARARTVDSIETAGRAAQAAGDTFQPDTLQAAALDQIGAQINSVAAQLRSKPVDEMVDDFAVFARKNPLLFLGGAALVGFAAARFLKSGKASGHVSDDDDDPWSGHLSHVEARK
ncbi:hypothetical protein [Marivita sp.]|uniref:hypothetical protein n=1 Tax=Marivita sp. TaxID=2003365 RepID=UPI0026094535|nr:hypothetical protein [Marivita sp.]